MIRNKSNGRCRVKCVPGKTTRSRSSGRCRKIKSITRKSRSRKSRSRKSSTRKSRSRKSSTRKSRSRKSRSRKSRSRKSSPMKRLPKCTKEEQTRSRKSRRCRVPPCPPGKIRNKSTGGKCRVKCSPGRIRGPTGRCIKRPKKPKTSSDETNLTNSGPRESNDLNDIQIWDMHDKMFPNSKGVIPPPGVNTRGFSDIDTPAWSSSSSADQSSLKYIKVDGVLQKNPAYTGIPKYKNVNGFVEHNPNYVGKTHVYSNYYAPIARRRRLRH